MCDVLVAQLCPTLYHPMNHSPPGSSVPGDSPGKNNGVAMPFSSLGDLLNAGVEPKSPTLQAESLPLSQQEIP